MRRGCDYLSAAADQGHARASEFMAAATSAANAEGHPRAPAKRGPHGGPTSGGGPFASPEAPAAVPGPGGQGGDDDWLVGVPVPSARKKGGSKGKKGRR